MFRRMRWTGKVMIFSVMSLCSGFPRGVWFFLDHVELIWKIFWHIFRNKIKPCFQKIWVAPVSDVASKILRVWQIALQLHQEVTNCEFENWIIDERWSLDPNTMYLTIFVGTTWPYPWARFKMHHHHRCTWPYPWARFKMHHPDLGTDSIVLNFLHNWLIYRSI